jgi:glutathione S-transferase
LRKLQVDKENVVYQAAEKDKETKALKEKLAALEEMLGYSSFIGGALIVVGAFILALVYRAGVCLRFRRPILPLLSSIGKLGL